MFKRAHPESQTRACFALKNKNFGDIFGTVPAQHVREKPVIFAMIQGFLVTAGIEKYSPANEKRRVRNGATVTEGRYDIIMFYRPAGDDIVTGPGDKTKVRARERNFRVCFHERELAFQPFRHRDIVGVQYRQVPSPRQAGADVPGIRNPAVFFEAVITQPVIDEPADDFGCLVSGSIIDHDDLEIIESLGEDAFEAGADMFRAIIYGDQNADSGAGVVRPVFGFGFHVSGLCPNGGNGGVR